MSASGGTYRAGPRQGNGRSQIPFGNSPSAIPRPAPDVVPGTTVHSDFSGSNLSASRQKQSKRDEVGRAWNPPIAQYVVKVLN